tara:strand:+ start:19499 stop:20656 length:1158 start_codon:yes stop_codon:yes gene_type:complete
MKIKKIFMYLMLSSLILIGCSDDDGNTSGPAEPTYTTGTAVFGDSTGEDVIYGIEKIAGGFLLTGNTASLNNGSSSDGLVMQVDAAGTTIWESTIDSGENGYDRLYDIEVDINGNIITAGFATRSVGGTDMWVAVLSSAGTLANMTFFGADGVNERAYTVGDWDLFDVYMLGGYNSDTDATIQYADRNDLSSRGADVLAGTSSWYRGIKTNDNLNILVGDILVDGQYDGIFSLLQDGVYVGSPGTVLSTLASRLYGVNNSPSIRSALIACGLADNGSGYIAKMNTSGSLVWETTTTQAATLYDIFEDSMGNIVAVGYSGADAFMVKLDQSGNILASKTFDGSGANDRFYGISESDNGEYVMVGFTEDSNGDKNGWMVTTNPEGNL